MNDPVAIRLTANTTTATWCGQQVRLRKIGATDGIALTKIHSGMQVNELGQPIERQDIVTFHAFAASKSVSGEDGALLYDSEAGRKSLESLPLEELVSLSEAALQWSGLAAAPDDQKKT